MPSSELRNKAVKALFWNAMDKSGFQFIALFVGIITARLLSPDDFGLMGALAIFTQLSNTLVESGFTSALVRRKENKPADYAAIFYFNVGLSVLIYLLLFVSAPALSDFFNKPPLAALARFLFLGIIINSLGIVQNIVLTKAVAFRQISIADLTSAIVAGIVAIVLALMGFGYWALAWQVVLQPTVRTLMLWMFSHYRFGFRADFRIIREVFAFSFFLLMMTVISTVVRNIYNVCIGRFYSSALLGFYNQANKFQQIPSIVVASTTSGVAYPILARLDHDARRQIAYLRKMMRITAFLIFPVMIGLGSLTAPLVSLVLTDKWLPAVPYFQLMIVGSLTFPLHSLNATIITVRGASHTTFMLDMLKNALILLTLLFYQRIEYMLIGFSVAGVVSWLADMIVTQHKVAYSILQQIRDIAPYALISGLMFLLVKAVGYLNLHALSHPLPDLPLTLLQILLAASFYFGTLYLLGSKVMSEALQMLRNKSAE
ncbi:MAG: lipopolysaccharide biosynthesis protein [Paludibacteraceae bacterium]|nr:lipopolysaccharide biosynthesis protein [Paludibacteraceae bacterium]